MFKRKCYLHIRHRWRNMPIEMGVSLLERDWEELKSHMTENAETSLGISVMKQMVKIDCVMPDNINVKAAIMIGLPKWL